MSDSHVEEFFAEYYRDADFSHWLKKINHSADKLRLLKTDKSKRGYLVELYSGYLQLIEILLTNMFIVTGRDKTLLEGMFISNKKLIRFAKRIQNEQTFYDWFLSSYVFGIKEKESIRNYEQKYDEHKDILSESIKDYTLDFQFLNAYKHGYRVRGSTQGQTYTLRTAGGKAVPFAKFDSSLIYFSKEPDGKNKNRQIIYENTLAFNLKRVVITAMCISTVLENMQKVLAAQANKRHGINLTHFYFLDKNIWHESFGNGRFKSDIFILTKENSNERSGK